MRARQLGILDTPIGSGGKIVAATVIEFTVTLGAVTALLGTRFPVNVPGLKLSDTVAGLSCITQPPLGMNIGNARVSAVDTLEILITTGIALGLNLNTPLTFRAIIGMTVPNA